MTSIDPTVSRSPSAGQMPSPRFGWAGIAFGILFLTGFFISHATPDHRASDGAWVSWYADDAHLRQLIVGAYLLVAAALSLLVLVSALVERTRSAGDTSPMLHRVGWGAGLLSAGIILVSAVQFAGIAGNLLFGSTTQVATADVLRQNLGSASLVFAGAVTAALFIACTATLARRDGMFGPGMSRFSYAVAVVLVIPVVFVPLLALSIWGVVAGIWMLRRH
jgi:hypothetical protein